MGGPEIVLAGRMVDRNNCAVVAVSLMTYGSGQKAKTKVHFDEMEHQLRVTICGRVFKIFKFFRGFDAFLKI